MSEESAKSEGPPAENSGGNCPYCGNHYDGDLTAHLGKCDTGPYDQENELGKHVGEVPQQADGGFSY